MVEPARIVIIGGGCGLALAHDLTLRGFHVCLVERGELTSGTTGRHHGLVHSGARYVLHDPATAAECYAENQTLRNIAPAAIEPNDGLFVALNDADMAYHRAFVAGCAQAGIPARPLDANQAVALEPGIARGIKAAVQVPDAVMDAWRLSLQFAATARMNGADIRPFTEATGLRIDARNVAGVRVQDLRSGVETVLPADLVVNAAGPWAGRIAAMAGLDLPLQPSPGVMVAVAGRLVNMVINRLQPAGEGDIIVPQRTLSVLGTTAWLAEDPDDLHIPEEHVQRLRHLAGALVPEAATAPVQAVWSAARPLLGNAPADDPFSISRGFACLDHAARDNLDGMVSLIGGKATTMRAMAEASADLICDKLGRPVACATGHTRLMSWRRAFGPIPEKNAHDC